MAAHTFHPTPAELAILQVLWDEGPSTVKTVHRHLDRTRAIGYTTVLKQLQIMHDKGLVRRDTEARAHVYTAAVTRSLIEQHLVNDLLHRVFNGSARRLMLRLLTSSATSEDDVEAIRVLLNQRKR